MMRTSPKYAANQVGFTLIELVATIIVIGVLAVTVLPRFSDRSGVAEYAFLDELIALAQQAQQRAMFDHGGSCYGVSLHAMQAVAEVDGAAINGQSIVTFDNDYDGLGVSPQTTIYFDALGNLLTGGSDCASSSIPAAALTVDITGGNNIGVLIHPTGYIQRRG